MAYRQLVVRALVIVAAFATLGSIAHAQPMGDGHGGPGGPGGMGLAGMLLNPQVHASLGLTAAQESQWSALQSAAQNLRTQLAASRSALHTTIAAEFAKATPDLALIENAVAAEQSASASGIGALRNQALALYATFSTGQQAIVIAAAQAGYQRLMNRPQPGGPGRP